MSPPSPSLTALFLTFHIAGGIVGLPLIILTIVASRQISRHPSLINFCATSTIASVVYTLLVYAKEERSDHPSFSLCLAQASMVNGVFPMTSVAGVCLIAHIWHGLGPSRPWSELGLASRDVKSIRLAGLLSAPYVTFVTFTVASAIAGHANTDLLRRSEVLFYCRLDSDVFNILVPTFTIIAIGIIFIMEGLIYIRINGNGYISAGIRNTGPLVFVFRLVGFTIYSILALLAAALFLADASTSTPYMIQSTLPVVVLIFIGTQKEVLEAWKRWVRRLVRSDNPFHRASRMLTKSIIHLKQDGYTAGTPSFAAVDPMQFHNIPSTTKPLDDANSNVFFVDVPVGKDTPLRPNRPANLVLYGASEGGAGSLKTELLKENSVLQDPNISEVIAAQKETIVRLLEESGYMSRTIEKLKGVEQTLFKTENLLITERRTAKQLRGYAHELEADLRTQMSIANDLAISKKDLDEKQVAQEELIKRLKNDVGVLSTALQSSMKSEKDWKEKHNVLKVEHAAFKMEVEELRNECNILLDIWSSLESPIDWEIHGSQQRRSPQQQFPELARRMRQRASTPALQTFSKRRMNFDHAQPESTNIKIPIDGLDRLRSKVLQLTSTGNELNDNNREESWQVPRSLPSSTIDEVYASGEDAGSSH